LVRTNNESRARFYPAFNLSFERDGGFVGGGEKLKNIVGDPALVRKLFDRAIYGIVLHIADQYVVALF
jgi:hypothetical protein